MARENRQQPPEVGEVFKGYAGGHFGRDSYEDKRVEAVGIDWIVCRGSSGSVHVATFEGRAERDAAVEDMRAEDPEVA